ncbi:MAG: prepilin-type N-terminal cleavage/methylation domain-containing protein [Planctomycetota bacterium]
MSVTRNRLGRRRGLSLLELLAVVTILGVIAAVVVPRLGGGARESKRQSCHVQVGIIEIQAAMWRRERGSWPQTDLADVGADENFFPEGIPTCPVDGTPYAIDAETGRVTGHGH